MVDKTQKGRNNNPRGMNANKSNLLDQDIIRIRELYKIGMTQQELADMFSVCPKTISYIINRITWNHI